MSVQLQRVLIVAAMIVYILSPLDIIPDVIPVAGQADDLAVLVLGIKKLMARR